MIDPNRELKASEVKTFIDEYFTVIDADTSVNDAVPLIDEALEDLGL